MDTIQLTQFDAPKKTHISEPVKDAIYYMIRRLAYDHIKTVPELSDVIRYLTNNSAVGKDIKDEAFFIANCHYSCNLTGIEIPGMIANTPEQLEKNIERTAKRVVRCIKDRQYCGKNVSFSMVDFRDMVGFEILKDGKTVGERIKNCIWSKDGVRLPSNVIETINNYVDSIKNDGKAVWVRTCDDYQHKSASYYLNGGSCWFESNGSYSDSRDILNSIGGKALLFFDDPEKNPISRAWAFEHGGNVCLINAYGRHTLRQMAEVIAGGESVHVVTCEFDTDAIYVNNSRAAVIGSSDSIYIDTDYAGSRYNCCSCGDRHDADDMIFEHDEPWCVDCHSDTFACCDDCYETYHHDETQNVNGRCVCDNCVNSDYTRCNDCGKYFRDDDSHYSDVCNSCGENYTSCETCSELTKEPIEHDGLYYCCDCAPEPEPEPEPDLIQIDHTTLADRLMCIGAYNILGRTL